MIYPHLRLCSANRDMHNDLNLWTTLRLAEELGALYDLNVATRHISISERVIIMTTAAQAGSLRFNMRLAGKQIHHL